jgi:hypothetical protein
MPARFLLLNEICSSANLHYGLHSDVTTLGASPGAAAASPREFVFVFLIIGAAAAERSV